MQQKSGRNPDPKTLRSQPEARSQKRSPNPIHPRLRSNDPCLMPHIEQPPNRLAAFRAVVEGALVYIHPDKFVGELSIKIASKLHGIAYRFLAMIESVLDTVAQRGRNGRHEFWPQSAPDCVAPQRQRQARHLLPPLPKVHDAVQPRLVIRELAFVDDEPSLILTLEHLRNDLIERNNFGLNPGGKKIERQICRSQRSWHGNPFFLDLALRESTAGHDHRAVSFAHTSPARQ